MSRRKSDPIPGQTTRPPAISPQQRENQLISAAHDLAERQILEGTASSQVITHFLKLGSSRERLEQQKIEYENQLLQVKKEAIEAQERIENLYKEAMAAMSAYQGVAPQSEGPEYDEFED